MKRDRLGKNIQAKKKCFERRVAVDTEISRWFFGGSSRTMKGTEEASCIYRESEGRVAIQPGGVLMAKDMGVYKI
jgi:hypothetical protein